MLDELAGWGLRPPVLAADGGYGDNSHFRAALSKRGIGYVVQVKGDATAHPASAEPELVAYSGRGPRPKPRYRTKPMALSKHVAAAGRRTAQSITWRQGSRAALSSQFVLLRVRVAGRRPILADDGTLPTSWLIAEWPHDADEPVKYWLSNLPDDTDPTELVRLAKIRWRIEHDYRELKSGLGLDHFEGRSFTGWHRHVTLVTAAHLFCTILRTDPKAAAPA
jgi:SRSO17 transposase